MGRAVTAGIGLIAALVLALGAWPAQQRSVDDFFRDFTADWVRHDPELAAETRYFTGEEQDRLERQMRPCTLAWRKERIARAKQGLAELRQFDRAKMSEVQQVSADLMQWQLQSIVDEEPYLDYTFPLEQFQGANETLVYGLTVVHPLKTGKDAENYVAALSQVSARMEEAMAESRRLAAEGILPPKFILQATIRQMQSFAGTPAAKNPLVVTLAEKMQGMEGLSEGGRGELRGQAEKIVAGQVYPAWNKGIALLTAQLPRSSEDAGLWRLKGGAEAYRYELRRFTTTDMTPEQIHELGLRQVATIEQRMDGMLRQLGRTEGTVKERIAKLQADMVYPNPTSDASREQIMRDIDAILRDAQKRATLLFDKQPMAAIVAQPYPAFEEASAAPTSTFPAPDGSRPGIFLYPRRPSYMTKFGLRSIVYHEAVPGHFTQGALETENTALPRFRQIRAFGTISAYTEGWALYVEHLATELDWYDGDLEGSLGQLSYELFRARRLVVDTGLHAEHWTRQQAIDYGIEPSEVERYVVFPGQACSYMIGEMKILELREKARKALGDKFTLRGFHDVVMETGTVPLELLERQVDAYVRATGGGR